MNNQTSPKEPLMKMENKLSRRFRKAAIFLIIFLVVYLGSIGIYRGFKILQNIQNIKEGIVDKEFRILRFETVSGNKLIKESAYINFNEDKFKILVDQSIQVSGNFEFIYLSSKIRFLNCSNLKEIICKDFSISVTDKGINLINDSLLISAQYIR